MADWKVTLPRNRRDGEWGTSLGSSIEGYVNPENLSELEWPYMHDLWL